MILALLKRLPYGWLIIVAAVLFYTFVVHQNGFKSGQERVQAQWDKERVELKRAYDAQLAVANEIERKQNAINAKIQTDYNRDVGLLSRRLRDIGATTCTVSSEANSATGTNQAPQAPASFRLDDALSDTLQCSKLIEWVKAQGFD